MKLAIPGSRQIKTRKVRSIMDAAIRVLTEYNDAGFSVTLRQLFYRLVSDGVLVNRVPDYRNLGRYINAAKESGEIDWDWVEDRTRFVRVRQRYRSTTQLLANAAQDWHIDFWEGQSVRPELWIEKDALLSIVAPVCHEFDVPYYSLRGWGRPSDKFDAARRFSQHADHGQRSLILHAGDYDPTGLSATQNVETEVSKYMRQLAGEFVDVRRIALDMDQIEQFNLAPNKIGEDGDKSHESRWAGFVQANNGRRDTWELDALPPVALQDIIREEIQKCIVNKRAWSKRQRLIQDNAIKLQALIEGAA